MRHLGMIAAGKVESESWLEERVKKVNTWVKEKGPLQLVDGFCVDEDGELSTAEGILELDLLPGQWVEKGQPIGWVVSRTPRPVETVVRAAKSCYVFSVPGSSVIEYRPGDVVFQGAEPMNNPRISGLYEAVQKKLKTA